MQGSLIWMMWANVATTYKSTEITCFRIAFVLYVDKLFGNFDRKFGKMVQTPSTVTIAVQLAKPIHIYHIYDIQPSTTKLQKSYWFKF